MTSDSIPTPSQQAYNETMRDINLQPIADLAMFLAAVILAAAAVFTLGQTATCDTGDGRTFDQCQPVPK